MSDQYFWTYDAVSDALYVYFSWRRVHETVANTGSSIMVDIDADGRARGVEILLPGDDFNFHDEFYPYVSALQDTWLNQLLRDKPWLDQQKETS